MGRSTVFALCTPVEIRKGMEKGIMGTGKAGKSRHWHGQWAEIFGSVVVKSLSIFFFFSHLFSHWSANMLNRDTCVNSVL
jgi:hypothetical protein